MYTIITVLTYVLAFCMLPFNQVIGRGVRTYPIQTIWISKILNKSTEGQEVISCPYSTAYLQYMVAAHWLRGTFPNTGMQLLLELGTQIE